MKSSQGHRLTPELIPFDLWGRSACQMLKGKAVWNKKIRQDAITAADKRCEICTDAANVLVCHEKWKYDDKARIATLASFEIHCRSCDAVTHVGRAAKVGNSEQVLIEAVMKLCEVNGCEPSVALKILTDALDLWGKRSEKKWTIAVAPNLLRAYPELEALPKFRARKSD